MLKTFAKIQFESHSQQGPEALEVGVRPNWNRGVRSSGIYTSEHFDKGKRQNTLSPEHIEKIVSTYQHRKEEDRYSRCVPMEEIARNDYNLNISRYVSTAKTEEEIDLQAVHRQLQEIDKKIQDAAERHNGFLEELGLAGV